MKIELNGAYKLQKLPHGASHAFVFHKDFVPEGWLDTCVPEDVRTALRRQGYLSGFYLGKDLEQERWIEEADWLYYRRFFLEEPLEGKTTLCFEGIDTLAQVWLNGEMLGECENMFLPHRFDVTHRLLTGETNVLAVRILSPVKAIAHIDRTGLFPQEDTGRLVLRKSQMNYGWDFCGHCLTTGLWKGVYLENQVDAKLRDVYLRTVRLGEGEAELALQAAVEWLRAERPGGYQARLCLRDQGQTVLEQTFAAAELAQARLRLPNPTLWWPRPYGTPHLYEAVLSLYHEGKVVDEQAFRFGVRTLELLQEPLPEGGRSFLLRVNGRELFIRGANWVPLHAVYGEITGDQYRRRLEQAVEGNLTMLRIWGGGIYESELFFDLCDEKGILIMQDFMLACGVLPQDDAFLEKVFREVDHIARAYRNRTCLALWSADNELDQAYWWYDLQAIFKTNKVNRVAVKEAIGAADPHRPFLVSSPCSPFEGEPGDEDPNSPLQGDMHVYLTRFAKDSPFYYKKLLEFIPRFMSEYGFSSLPGMDSYARFNFFGKALDLQANPWLGELPAFQRLSEAGSVEDIIYETQFTHAQGLKYWIEYMRSHKGICGGSLYWKFNDPVAPNRENMLFPGLMSCVDFFGLPKLAFDYTRRAYEDKIIAFREEAGCVKVFGCNETLREDRGRLKVSWMGYDGTETPLVEQEAALPADASTQWASIQVAQERASWRGGYLKAVYHGEETMENRFFLGDIGEYVGVKPPQTLLRCVEFTRLNPETLELVLRAEGYVQDVRISVLDVALRASDNAFCMDAHTEKRVWLRLGEEEGRNRCLRIAARNAPPLVFDLNQEPSKGRERV